MRKFVLTLGLVLLLLLAVVPPSSAASPPPEGFWHYVRRGETLSSIGRLYGVNAYSICSANGLSNCNIIWVGQALWIPRGYTPRPGPDHRPHPRCAVTHTVRHGQTLHSIGRYYGVNPWAIASVNGIYNMNLIYAGQRLCIPDP
jgi:LysM repeat protein